MDTHSNNNFYTKPSTLRDYVRIIFRQKFIIFITVATVMISTYIGQQLRTPVYSSQVKMLITGSQQSSAVYYDNLSGRNDQDVGLTRSRMVKAIPVVTMVVEALQLDQLPLDFEKDFATTLRQSFIKKEVAKFEERMVKHSEEDQQAIRFRRAIEKVRKATKVEPIQETNLLIVRVTDYSPMMASIIANSLSRAYMIFDLQQQLAESQLKYGGKHPIIRQLKDNIDLVKESLHGERLDELEALGPATIKIIEQAIPAMQPEGVQKKQLLILALIMSVFLGVLLAFVFEFMDQSVKSPKDLQDFLKLPLLGTIPRRKFWQKPYIKDNLRHWRSHYIDSYRSVCDQLRLLLRTKEAKSVLITGPDLNEGSTTTIANIAFYLSHHMLVNVLVVDANYRDNAIQKVFKVAPSPGLADVLEGKASFKDAVQEFTPHLSVVSSGVTNQNPLTLMDSKNMKSFLDEAEKHFDLVIFDCANLNHYKDAVVIGSYVDGVVLLITESKTRRQVIETSLEPMKANNARILGTILNKRTYSIPTFIYKRI